MCAMASSAGLFAFGRFGHVDPMACCDLVCDLVETRVMASCHAIVC